MTKFSFALWFRIALCLLLPLSTPLAAKDVDETRAAYVAALVAGMRSDSSLTVLASTLSSTEIELSVIRAAEQKELGAALAGPQAALFEAEEAARELSLVDVPSSARLSQVAEEIGRLENKGIAINVAALDRASRLENLDAQLNLALANQEKAHAALDTEQTNLASLKTAQQDIAQLQALARTGAGLQDPRLREYVWSTNSPRGLVSAAREAFMTSAVSEIFDVGDGGQARYGEYSSRSNVWKFDDVPQGVAWLLWDTRTDGPIDLSRPRDDLFEQPVFLKIQVSGNILVAAADLQRVEIGDVKNSPWPTFGATTFDSCIARLVRDSEAGAIRQICQTLYPEDARFEVNVMDTPSSLVGAILLSGMKAYAFAELYHLHLVDLRDLSNGEVPMLLLPAIQQALDRSADEVGQKIEAANGRVPVAELKAKTSDDEATRRQQARDTAAAGNASATILDEQSVIEINARLTELKEELAEFRAQADLEAALLAARRAEAAEAVRTAQAAIVDANARVVKDWEERREQAEQAVVIAREAFAIGQQESNSNQSLTILEQEGFITELSRGKIVRSVTFERDGEICLSIQNSSTHYVKIEIGSLLFRGQIFPRPELLGSGFLEIFRNLKSGVVGNYLSAENMSFYNRYREVVAGLPPSQSRKECSSINEPNGGELGRFFDSIGGFSKSGWDVELDVQFGTFKDTDKEITFVAKEVIFADDLMAARNEAAAVFQNLTAELNTSVSTNSEPDGAQPDLETPNGVQTDKDSITANQTTSIGPDKPDTVAGIDYADDEVIAIDRVIGRELQAALNAAGFYVGEPDGIIGPRSIKAITDWQSEEGFVATGTLTRSQAALLLGYNLP
jgi:hypothetical protein